MSAKRSHAKKPASKPATAASKSATKTAAPAKAKTGPVTGKAQETENELVQSFLAVRKALGVLGLALPASLALYGILSREGIAPSISEFYFTRAGDLLVGVMVAIGVFLWAYKGYDPRPGEMLSDWWVSRAAAVGALGVAFVPTLGPERIPHPLMHDLLTPYIAQKVHYTSAALFFCSLAVFCLVLFRRSGKGPLDTDKQAKNKIYFACGLVLVAVVVGLFGFSFWYGAQTPERQAVIDTYDIVFALETIGVIAFSVSWLVKGETLSPLKTVVKRMTPDGG